MKPRFDVGDEVIIKGYTGVYRIISHEITTYTDANGSITELVYECLPRGSGLVSDLVSACEEDLTLIKRAYPMGTVYITLQPPEEDEESEDDSRTIRLDYTAMSDDDLFRVWEDYTELRRTFGDSKYERRARLAWRELMRRKGAE